MVVHAVDRAEGDDDRTAPTSMPVEPGPARWRVLALEAAVVFGLTALAVTQPVLDLFGRNPTFFVAGGYGRKQIVAFAVVVALVPGLVVWVVTTLPGLVHRRAAAVLHHLRVALLGGLFGLVLARTFGLDGVVVAFGFAAAIGAAVALAEGRWRPARQFLAYLAVSNVVFLLLFLLASPTTDLLRGATYADAGEVMVPPLDGPVTVIVLDEFPLASLLRPDGTINEVRFPNLAALAGEATWFRNASSESSFTAYSVPSILSGRRAANPDLPILRDFPRNYFTLFGQSYPVQRYEAITDLCPPDACGRPPAEPLSQALDDAALVYRHRVLPESWRADLPPVDEGWGQFDEAADAADAAASEEPVDSNPNARLDLMPKEDRGKGTQLEIMRRQVQGITADPSINLVHVLVPHTPHVLTPWGTTGIRAEDLGPVPEPGSPGYERPVAERLALQALQIGAVDQAIGDVVGHLKAIGAWDTGTFVLTSDHGRFMTVPGNGRSYAPEIEDELLRIPLFIKAPGQTAGETRDEPATTLDILPSLIDILGIETDWDFDGHSLFDGSEPGTDRNLTSGIDGLYDVAELYASFFGAGDSWEAAAAIGPRGDLVGTSVLDHDVGDASGLTWSLDNRASLDDPAGTAGAVPLQMTGTLHGGDGRPDDLVVAVDGTIAGTIGVREEAGDGWRFSGVLGPPGARGEGEQVTAYEVEDTAAGVVLHPLGEA